MESSVDRIKSLYPMVDENVYPLPRQWNMKDKSNNLLLGANGLTVTYQASGKSQKEAASVRASHPIPASCGLYYYEVKIISKGRDGYIGVGLSQAGVPVHRLPGWDKNSYGYHGDDGHSFNASPCGVAYGPTFTSGDIIGCCVNFVRNEIFYTKNGVPLGRAFENRVTKLYPTVGLKTPGEQVQCNFGADPFCFDLEAYICQVMSESLQEIRSFSVANERGQFNVSLERLVLSYLTHCGYSDAAEALGAAADLKLSESLASMRNRQNLQNLVLSGRIEQAIDLTQQLYPGLLDKSPDLLFMLKVRQFIEMVNSTARCIASRSPCPDLNDSRKGPTASAKPVSPRRSPSQSPEPNGNVPCPAHVANGVSNGHMNGDSCGEAMDCDAEPNPEYSRLTDSVPEVSDDSTRSPSDSPPHKRQFCAASDDQLQQLIQFGRELYRLSRELKQEHGKNPASKQMLEEAFSLLAYSDPWSSPVGAQLQPQRREAVAAALNTAVLESQGTERVPLLQLCVSHTQNNLRLISERLNEGWIAFVSPSDWVRQASDALLSVKSG